MARTKKSEGMFDAPVGEKPKKKRKYEKAIVVDDPGIPCPHCAQRYGHKVTNTYQNGNRRHRCGDCGKHWITRRPQAGAA